MPPAPHDCHMGAICLNFEKLEELQMRNVAQSLV